MWSCMMFYYIVLQKEYKVYKQRVTCMFFFSPNKHLFITRKDAIYALFVRWAALLIS